MRARGLVSGVSFLLLAGLVNGQGSVWQQSVAAAEALQAQGRSGEAEAVLLNSLRDTAGATPGLLALIHNNLASATQDQGRYTEAERHYRRSIALWESLGPSGRLGRARTINNLASLLWFVGRSQEAERALEESAQQHFDILGPDDPETSVVYTNLGTMQLKKRKWKEAERSFQQALGKLQGPARETRVAGWLHYGIGVACRSTRRAAEAEGHFRAAQAIWEQHRSNGELEPRHLVHLAVSYRYTGQPDQAENLLRQVIDAVESDGRMTPGKQALLLNASAEELKQFPQMAKEARELERRAKRILASDTQMRMSRETIHVSALTDESLRR